MGKIITALALLFALCSCQTPYREIDAMAYGVKAEALTFNTYRIIGRGSNFDQKNTIIDYALLKAAETTVSRNGTHFIIASIADVSQVSYGQTAGFANTTFGRSGMSTIYTPGMLYSSQFPGVDMIIQIGHVPRGQAVPAGAISAQDIIMAIGPRVKRKGA
jgi:hypothetical protein